MSWKAKSIHILFPFVLLLKLYFFRRCRKEKNCDELLVTYSVHVLVDSKVLRQLRWIANNTSDTVLGAHLRVIPEPSLLYPLPLKALYFDLNLQVSIKSWKTCFHSLWFDNWQTHTPTWIVHLPGELLDIRCACKRLKKIMGSPITNDLKIILSRYSFHSQFWEVSLVSTCLIDRSFGKMIKLNRLRASKHCFNNTYHWQSLLCNFTPWTPFTCFPSSKSNHRSLTIRGLGAEGLCWFNILSFFHDSEP